MNALEILTNELVGKFIFRFSIGDTWDLFIGDYCFVAQEIISEDEKLLNQWYKINYASYLNCVDKTDISKSTIVAAHLRKEIIGIKLDELCNLTIEFEQDSALLVPTNVEIVDWQWCLNKTGKDPYMDFRVACFSAGEIEVNDEIDNTFNVNPYKSIL